MDPVTTVDTILNVLGYGKYVVLVSAVVGAFSALSTVYNPAWRGAATIHRLALLVGNAKPEVPAASIINK